MKKVVIVSGTSRPDNYTSRAANALGAHLSALGLEVELVDGREVKLAFPGEDPTEDAKRMTKSMHDADAIVMATPEYHGSFSAYIKLVIENLGFPSPLKGKPVSLLGVASGRIGAIKSLEMLRSVCAHTGAFVLPGALSIAGVDKLFDDEGKCTDEGTNRQLAKTADALNKYLVDSVCPEHDLESAVRSENGAAMLLG